MQGAVGGALMGRPKIKYGEKFGIKLWFPPEGVLDVAQSRTIGAVAYFNAVHHSLERYNAHLQMLASSCYLQGLNDGIDVAIKAGWTPRSTRKEGYATSRLVTAVPAMLRCAISARERWAGSIPMQAPDSRGSMTP